jgi:hypothetical protein
MKKRPYAKVIAEAIGPNDLVAKARRRRFHAQGAQRVTNRGNSQKGRLRGKMTR